MTSNSGMENLFSDDEENQRFSQLVDEAEIKERKITKIPRNTRYANNWHIGVWREWASWRNTKMAENNSGTKDKYDRVPYIDDRHSICCN